MEPGPFQHIRHLKKRAFLVAYAACGNIVRASEAAGVHRSSHFHWVKSDEPYAQAFREAEHMAGTVLEAEARRRAAEGIDKPIYYQGQRVDTIKEYSDTLLIFLLKGALPHKYREGWDFEQRLAAVEERLKREAKPS